ncbi:hypothetical protein ACFLT1_09455 [Bacteroidota bacterium]
MRHKLTYFYPARLFLLIVLALAISFTARGQEEDLKETFILAESYFLYGEYNEALPEYSKLNRAYPENNNINYKIGICLLNVPFQKDKAIDYLLKASLDVNEKYKQNNFKEKSAPPEVFFYLGNAYLANDSIEKARETYEYFLEILDEKIYDKDLVEEQIATCDRALELKMNPVDFDYENLGEKINSNFSDKNPIISGDRTKVVYTSDRRFYKGAAFYSEKVDGEWNGGRNILFELGVDSDVYPTCLSYDGTTMIIYRNDDFVGNLYYSKLVDGFWTELVKLGSNINTKYWESHGTLSKDGSKLYFTSNRKGGYGGLDIYVSEKLEDGTWGPPDNLGSTINTKYNDDRPVFSEDENTMYFCSFGHNNMGGYDIFYSVKNEDGEWSAPVNVGFPINTSEDDLYFFPVNNGFNAYVSKYFDGGFGEEDLYYLTLYSDANPRRYKVSGEIISDEGPFTAEDDITVSLVDVTKNRTLQTFSPEPGSSAFDLTLTKGAYKLVVTGDGFDPFEQDILINASTNKQGFAFPEPLVVNHEYIPQTFSGEMSRIEIIDTLVAPAPGDTARISLLLVENSSLTATHVVDSLEIKRDSFYIEQPEFEYEAIPEPGSNVLAFEMVEETGDTSLTKLEFTVEKPVIPVQKLDTLIEQTETVPVIETPETVEPDTVTPELLSPADEITTEDSVLPEEEDTEKRPGTLTMVFIALFLLFVLIYLRRNRRKK